MIKNTLHSVLACFLTIIATQLAAKNDLRNSVVVVSVFQQKVNPYEPWTHFDVTPSNHLATCVGKNLYLVASQAVVQAKSIEMQRIGSSIKYPMSVVFSDFNANLALLKASNGEEIESCKPLPLGVNLSPGSRVELYYPLNGTRLQSYSVEIDQVEVGASSISSYPMPYYLVESKKGQSLGWSEPVLKDSTLVGISVQSQQQALRVVPASILRHFLKDYMDKKPYKGFPYLGLVTHSLISPYFREKLRSRLPPDRGVRIVEVSEHSPFLGKIKPDDILLAVENKSIDQHGYFIHPLWGQVYLSALVSTFYGGTEITLEVERLGKKMKFSAVLLSFDPNRTLIPYTLDQEGKVDHIIFGGFIFQELSLPFLKVFGADWQNKAPDDLVYFVQNHNQPDKDPRRRVIILNHVLADSFNRGLKDYSNLILLNVNHQPVSSLAQVRRVLRENPILKDGKKYASFHFQYGVGEIVLGYEGLDSCHERLAKNYGIQSDETFWKEHPP